jgi:HNH endonuclease
MDGPPVACSVPGCANKVIHTGRKQTARFDVPYCNKHYGRASRGEPMVRERERGDGVLKEGYLLVKAHGHPAATKKGYVFQHRLVMEQVLGRYLLPEENVHHMNGVRDDNRPENLELWNTSQPAGQRAADKLEWARRIVELYSPSESVLSI